MAGSVTEIVVPYLGAAVEEGVVTQWIRGVGDAVRQGEPVCEIATDKVDMEVEAPEDGVIVRVLVEVDEAAAIGAPIAELAPPGSQPAEAPTESGQAQGPAGAQVEPEPEISGEIAEPAMLEYMEGQSPPAAPSEGQAGRHSTAVEAGRFEPDRVTAALLARRRRDGAPLASPVARRIAAEHGLPIDRIEGGGGGGRIRKADVLRALEEAQRPEPARAAASVERTGPPADGATDLPAGYEDVPFEPVAHTRLRRSIAEHMVRSRRTAAHVTTAVEVDMSAAERAREAVNSRRDAAGSRRLSPLPFVGRVAAATLLEFPDLNATFAEDRTLRWKEVNLGVAVDAGAGLLVPVVRGAEGMTVDALGEAISAVARRTRDGEIAPDDLAGGTFTITNVGPMGAIAVAPTINQPQVAILGMPATVKRPVVIAGPEGEDLIAVRPMLQLSLTFDHRVVDGAEATRCVARMKGLLESWNEAAYS